MTVKEMIAILQTMPQDAKLLVDTGETFCDVVACQESEPKGMVCIGIDE